MIFFQRNEIIAFKLNKLTIESLIIYPYKKEAGTQEFYIAEVVDSNHLQILVKHSKIYGSGIYEIDYDLGKEQIRISGKPKNLAKIIFLIPIIMVLAGVVLENQLKSKLLWSFAGSAIFLMYILTLKLGIREEVKEIKRDLINRINYCK